MHTLKISTAFWYDHSSRLWEPRGGGMYSHIDAGLYLWVVKMNDKQITLQLCMDGVKELYSDASYQCENADGAYRSLTRRVMTSIMKQVELPQSFIEKWRVR